jgi:PAS domain S-box-containing protein
MTDNGQPAAKVDGPASNAAVNIAPQSQSVTRDLRTRTERVQEPQSLLDSERLRPLSPASLDSLNIEQDAMLIVDRSGRIVSASDMTETLFGYERSELLGAPVELLVPFRLRAAHEQHRDRYLNNPSDRRMGAALSLFGARKDGTEFPVVVALTPVEAEPRSYVIVKIRNVSERRRFESALLSTERMASLGILSAGIAHEINGTVGAALLTAETALAAAQQNEQAEKIVACLQNIISAMDRCGGIVRNVLRFARNDTGEQVLCDLNEIVWRVNDLLRSQLICDHATLQCDLCENPLIQANPLEIEMLVANVTRNAIESKESGAQVTIQTAHTNDSVRLTVSDNGRGMSESHVRRIFEPFFTSREGVGGTGLGMSIVHRIAQLHQATIAVDSRLSVGTTVRVDFRRLPDAGREANGPISDAPPEKS